MSMVEDARMPAPAVTGAGAVIERAHREWMAAVDAVRDPMMVHDTEFRVVRCNRAYALRAGMAYRDLIGRHYFECFPKRDGPLPECSAFVRSGFLGSGGQGPSEEFTLPTGEVFLSRVFAVDPSEGGPAYALHIFEDITLRRHADRQIRRLADELKKAQQLAHIGSWELDRATGEVTWSEEVFRIFGHDPARPAPRLEEPLLSPASDARMRAAVHRALESGAPYEIDLELARPDGATRCITARGEARRDERGRIVGLRGTVQDITGRKQAEESLRTSEAQLSNALHIARAGHWAYDVATHVFTFNDLFYRVFRTTAEEQGGYLMSMDEYVRRFVHAGDVDIIAAATRAAIDATDLEFNREIEHRIMYADGRTGYVAVRFFIEKDPQGRTVRTFGVTQDITERKRAEIEVEKHLRRIRGQSEVMAAIASADALYSGDVEGLARQITEQASRVTGVERANVWLFNENETELHCIDLYEATPARHSKGMVLDEHQFANEFRALKSSSYVNADDPLTDPRTAGYVDAYLKPLNITSMLDAVVRISDRHFGLLCLEHVNRPHHWEPDEITFCCQLADKLALAIVNRERLSAEASMRESEERHRLLFESSKDAFMTLAPPDWRFVSGNPSTIALFRAKDEAEFVSKAPWQLSPDFQPDGRASAVKAREMIDTAMRDGNAFFEWTHRRLDGEEFPATVLLTRLELKGRTLLNACVRDITERKRSEQTLQKLNRTLMTLSAGNEALVRGTDERALLADMCRVLVEIGGYYHAFVAYARDDAGKSVEIVAVAGADAERARQMRLSWGDDEFGRGAVGTAIRTGRRQVLTELQEEPRLAPWRSLMSGSAAASVAALPLKSEGGRTLGALAIASTHASEFDEQELKLLEELAQDLTFGITSLRTREARRQDGERLHRSFESTIEALAATAEMRDPYTAGHQRHVAELAAAIGRELGFDEQRVAGLHFASAIHDIGKIYIPAEILARPGRLTPAEFEIIKTHPQVGHDIVRGVDFPWPVAQMILQHHERLDGSGYPQGLKGDQIILDARVLTVADVVEAMSSHRPYRPGLGIDVALQEIARNRGTFYDTEVVDACLRLFREKGFSFSPGRA